MKYNELMIRYGELSTKGKNRGQFIEHLRRDVKTKLANFQVKVVTTRDHLHVILNDEDPEPIIKVLQTIFGIQNICEVVRVELSVDEIKAAALFIVNNTGQNALTFKVRTKRSNRDFLHGTFEMNNLIGDLILEKHPGLTVDVHDPDLELTIEIRSDAAYLYSKVIPGAHGMPAGTAGLVQVMLSGGIDSPVAAYLALKRGMRVEMIHFYSPPYTSPQALAKSKELTKKLIPFTGSRSVQFIAVPFAKIQENIKQKVPEGYLMTIQRRMMLRIADRIRELRHGLAIVTGESVGQVASQTLESMMAINDVTNTPVIRPLVSFDKNEIIKIAKDIDTFELSIMPFEDCCTIFAPPQPKTKPRLVQAQEYEKLIEVDELINDALEHLEITNIESDHNYLNGEEEQILNLL
ncbi:tRNA uracil 4-sulfurtransferase ThiI [Xylocopilactobacillus apicola]|uniref:Probable tRNA sulfurtransferase n=1 Tax=Xylocopilactobacillus apicola TaxID=2932184 RepID=A0AAU9DIP8_9LACO|nr:tRNA uracil 4-sulfurtransferase ThiI [Xylocopilactobacillus apicola]BDR58291.1 putative tRNA sulfurtransferase [Xylocopilactobacillus apicola]